jgi:nucleoid-associated protein YgaU
VTGDTLTRIAQTYYGTQSADVIDALFEANRSVLRSVDALNVGDELSLPVIDGRVPKAVVGTAHSVQAGEAPRASSASAGVGAEGNGGTPFRWYQIKKNDRYMTIAREQLGSESRWREIYELNIDKFPDPERIREGVRIKLPTMGSPAGTGARP